MISLASSMVEQPTAIVFEPPANGEAPSPEFSDDHLALRFSARHSEDLRYVARFSRWMRWDGKRWAEDDTLNVFDSARVICREASSECLKLNQQPRIASSQTVAAVERLARSDRKHAATADQWDADPWALNTPGGVVNLRTGQMQAHDRTAYATKMTSVAPAPTADCPTWRWFLDDVMDGDAELVAFLKRMAGYSLTGITRDHALFFGYGTGANGKGTFIRAIAGILADYATTAPMETFVVSHGDRHPTELAGLRGARLVVATETEEGRRWNESRIKALTGGDKISARFMRGDFFEFEPAFKLLVTGNHKPGIRTVDEAIKRRLHLIPFTKTIPAEDRDPTLDARLEAEWPDILRWCIEGCLEWQQHGLAAPEAITKATTDYLTAEDALGQWIAEACMADANNQANTSDLFVSWKRWADRAGEPVGSAKRFSEALEARGYQRTRTKAARGFLGLCPRPEYDPGGGG